MFSTRPRVQVVGPLKTVCHAGGASQAYLGQVKHADMFKGNTSIAKERLVGTYKSNLTTQAKSGLVPCSGHAI